MGRYSAVSEPELDEELSRAARAAYWGPEGILLVLLVAGLFWVVATLGLALRHGPDVRIWLGIAGSLVVAAFLSYVQAAVIRGGILRRLARRFPEATP